MPFDPERVRPDFPALSRRVAGRPVVHLDGPAGSQVPQRVADAVAGYLLHTNANHGGDFATARESDAVCAEAHRAAADLFGADDPDLIAFGPNMTTSTFALSRAVGRTLRPGDQVVVTRLDHDANITPWVRAAEEAEAIVRRVDVRRHDCTLDLEDLERALDDRTRLVAVAAASNAVGTVHPVRRIADAAHEVGALVFVDAVHFAPHALMDVEAWGADFAACSAYKLFGPHVGMLWGRRELLTRLPAYRVRPAPLDLPGRWMTGTQCHEGLAGLVEAVEYLADIGRDLDPACATRREALATAFGAIVVHERALSRRLLDGLSQMPWLTVYGITDPTRDAERLPTVSFTHATRTPRQLAKAMADDGIFAWAGHHYALELSEALDLEPEGMLRVGLLHYNTAAEVDRLLQWLAAHPPDRT